MKIYDFFDLNRSLSGRLLSFAEYPWDALDMLGEYIMRVGKGLASDEFNCIKRGVWVAKSADVSNSAVLRAPLIVDRNANIGQGALVCGSIIGKGALVGSFSEVKSSVFFDGAHATQNNYISDSIVGYKAKFGTGAIVSSRSVDRTKICCLFGKELISCERRKFGAVVGDMAEIGCSSVLTAGCVVERGASVSPISRVRGFISADGRYAREKIVSDML